MTCDELLADYVARLVRLEQHYLQHALARAKTGDPLSESHLDSTRAFVVAAYAETEMFLECLSLMLVERIDKMIADLEEEINENQRASRQLVSSCEGYLMLLLSGSRSADALEQILSTKKVSEKLNASSVFKALRGRIKSLRSDISDNHGLLAADVHKLFDRVGCDTASDFTAMTNGLSVLNTRRSQFAHSGVAQEVAAFYYAKLPPARPIYVPHPTSERQLVISVSHELSTFVKTVARHIA